MSPRLKTRLPHVETPAEWSRILLEGRGWSVRKPRQVPSDDPLTPSFDWEATDPATGRKVLITVTAKEYIFSRLLQLLTNDAAAARAARGDGFEFHYWAWKGANRMVQVIQVKPSDFVPGKAP